MCKEMRGRRGEHGLVHKSHDTREKERELLGLGGSELSVAGEGMGR